MWRLTRRAPEPRAVLLFGAGLVGDAIRVALERDDGWAGARLPWSWTDADAQRRHLDALAPMWASAAAVDVVWAAGRAGFGADAAACADEREAFARILTRLEALGGGKTTVHLLSSAGGLFEGQRLVTPASVPSPQRPYGHLKLAQEDLLRARPGLRGRIYRLTSVYGPVQGSQRRGLVATMILNGLANRVTRIVGHMHTLRDYTFTGDIARHVTRRIRAGAAADEVAVLAAGRPASIHEIRRRVEAALGRRLYVSFDGQRSNAADMTYSRATWPTGWTASDLTTNLQTICRQVLHASAWTERAS